MNPERDADIVRLLLAGVPRKEVAEKYKITPERVAQIGEVRGGIARSYSRKKPSRSKPMPKIFGLDPAVERAAERLQQRGWMRGSEV